MNLKDKAACAFAVLKAGLLKHKTPLIVSWAVTYRCNGTCAYCSLPGTSSEEAGTAQALALIGELARLGTRVLVFTGGEPLLRDDIGDLLREAKRRGLTTGLNTNGSLVAPRLAELSGVDKVTLSLDGPQPVHDAVRGASAYGNVMRAAAALAAASVKFDFCCVLTGKNGGAIEYLARLAAEHKAGIFFQPASRGRLGSGKPNELSPDRGDVLAALKAIKRLKQTNKHILNSDAALDYLLSWPQGRPVTCGGALLSCRIEPNGDVGYCGRETFGYERLNAFRVGFRKAFEARPPAACAACWCANRLELPRGTQMERGKEGDQGGLNLSETVGRLKEPPAKS
jgi:MoaA/NifB/PqqE/SkfB family radical SAM enzyme